MSATFSGAAYTPDLDRARLSAQIERIRVWALARNWFTLREARVGLERLYSPTLFPEASISANLRNCRKRPLSHRLDKRRRVGVRGPGAGIWEYRLLPPEPQPQLGLFVEKKKGPTPTASHIESEPDDGKGREEFFRAARRIAGLQ